MVVKSGSGTAVPGSADPNLAKIDAALSAVAKGYDEIIERVKKIDPDTVSARLAALDLGLRDMGTWRNEAEQRIAAIRFGNGGDGTTDALLQLMTPEEKQWLLMIRNLSAGAPVGLGADGSMLRRPEEGARLAQRDPVSYLGIGLMFQAAIKASLATRSSKPEKAAYWSERRDKLAEALGGVSSETKAALQEDVNAEGGFLVPTLVEALIGALLKEYSVVRAGGATVMPMTAKAHQLPSLANDFSVSWTNEEGTIVDAAPATPFSGGQLVAKKQTGLVTVSMELAQDNVVGLMDFIVSHLIQQIGRAEDAQALEGDGTVFTGLFSAAGVNSVAGGSNALSEDELRRLIYGGEHQSTINQGVIFCHPWIVRDAMGLVTSNAIWFPYLIGGNAPTPRNIWGQPTFPTSVISRTRGGGTNETTAYHGDPRFLVIGDRMGTLIDVNPWSETEFKKGQILLRVMRRVGVQVWVPGYFTKLTAVTVSA